MHAFFTLQNQPTYGRIEYSRSRQIRSVGISDYGIELQSNTEKIQRERIFEERSTEGLQRHCVFGQTILLGLFG